MTADRPFNPRNVAADPSHLKLLVGWSAGVGYVVGKLVVPSLGVWAGPG